MRLLLDQDGVITKTVDYWLSLYNRDWFDNLTPKDIVEWEMHKFVKPECGKAFYGYMDHTPKFFQYLEPMEGVVEAIQELQELGHDVLIVTATPRNCPTGFYDKVKWVEKHLPFFSTKNIVATHRKDAVQGDILLDDGPHNIEAFRGRGLTVVYNQPWNQDVKSDYRVKTWPEFVQLIKTISASIDL